MSGTGWYALGAVAFVLAGCAVLAVMDARDKDRRTGLDRLARQGGRSSLGRHSAWPAFYQSVWRVGVVTGVVAIPLGAQHGLRVAGVALTLGAGLVLAGWLYNRRWLRLQGELFRRRS